ELWWDLAKAFILPVPSTVSELEPHKQRICTDQSFLLSILTDSQKCSYSWQVLQFVSEDLKDDREVFRAAICSQPQGWKSLRFASLNVRKDTSLCHEAVKRNVAAIEYIPSELRHNGTFLSLWLHSAMQKLNTKPENKFESDFNKALRSGAQPRKGVGMQDAKNVKTERVVPLAALCVQCGTRCILVSIGYYKTATKTAVGDLRYPGLKVKAGESPYDAAARLCKTRLSSWTEYVQVETSSFDAKEEDDISHSTGLPSRYLRTIFRGHMNPSVPWAKHVKFIPSRLGGQPVKLSSKQNSLADRFRRAHNFTLPPLPPDIFAFKKDIGTEEVVLYSWMPDWEFEHLRYTEQGRSLVRFWVEQGDFSILDPSAERCFTPALSSPERPLKFSAAKRTVLSPQKILNLAKALALKREAASRKVRASVVPTY
ncbi:Uncharacterized protein SCF082_LOCUS45642, partial [Durusdinium trenchii]